jgi:hypothetical protein
LSLSLKGEPRDADDVAEGAAVAVEEEASTEIR